MKSIATLSLGSALIALAAPALSMPTAPGPDATVISQTTEYTCLELTEGRIPVAPQGKLVTLTVDGVETPLAAGRHCGKVVLSVTDDIPVKYKALPEHHYRTALYVDNGQPIAARSVSAAVRGATLEAGSITDARITSVGERFNGIVVTGQGKYQINRPIIDLTGNGGNDFAGFGAAIMASGQADVTVNGPIIRTTGSVRPALFVGGNSVMRVNDAEIEVRNGTLPADYTFTVDVGRMMEVPWMLGLSGNVRASNLVDSGTLYITNSHIRAQGWGGLSTDDTVKVRMFVKDSLIETIESGYGAYSIGDSLDHFSHSVIRAADIGAIVAGEASLTLTDRTLVTAGLYGVMLHSGSGGGTITIDKGSELHAGRTAIQAKGRGTDIVVDSAVITAAGGIILQAMDNDDPFMKAMMSGNPPPGMTAPPPGMGADGGAPNGKSYSPDVTAVFRHVALDGDFWNGRTKEGNMTLRFEDADVAGRISTSTVAPASGTEPVRATYREIGNVVNTAAVTGRTLAVSLDTGSAWTVTGQSLLTRLELAPGARILAPASKQIELRVNGRKVAVRPGTYTGAITLNAR